MSFHFWHKWEAIAVQYRFQPFKDPLENVIHKDVGTFYTDIMYKCKECPKLKIVAVKGTWTLEHVKGEAQNAKEEPETFWDEESHNEWLRDQSYD